jgi:hypothetical protein
MLVWLAGAAVGCGGAPRPAEDVAIGADDPSAAPSSLEEVDGAPPTGDLADAPADDPAAGGQAETAEQELARYLIKRPGRRVGYSSQKKSFAITRERVSADGFTVDVAFTDKNGKETDVVRICDPSECDEMLNELAKQKIPALADRFARDGYVAVRAVGWPSGRGELEVGSIDAKLVLEGRRLNALREGKPAANLGTLPASAPALLAIFAIPDDGLLGLYAAADENGANMEFLVFPVRK